MTICMSCLVSGQVQGVAFRAAARRQALALGVTGWARNLPDGHVEVLACGEADQVEKLCGWLWRGPPLAHVTDVVCAPTDAPGITGFEIK